MTKLTGKDFNIGDKVKITAGSGRELCGTVFKIGLAKTSNNHDLVYVKVGSTIYNKYPFNLALIEQPAGKTKWRDWTVGDRVLLRRGNYAGKEGTITRFYDNGLAGIELHIDDASIEVKVQGMSMWKPYTKVPTPPVIKVLDAVHVCGKDSVWLGFYGVVCAVKGDTYDVLLQNNKVVGFPRDNLDTQEAPSYYTYAVAQLKDNVRSYLKACSPDKVEVKPAFVEPIPEPTPDQFVLPKFWIVWSPPQNAFPGSQKPPKARFDSHAKAKEVAASMAQKNPGQKFYVCEVTDSYRSGVVHKELA